jgi:cytohesin
MKHKARIRAVVITLAVLAICSTWIAWLIHDHSRKSQLNVALAAALQKADIKRARSLVEQGADPNIHEDLPSPQPHGLLAQLREIFLPLRRTNGTGKTALILAAGCEDLDFVNLLLSRGADVNAESDGSDNINTALQAAAYATYLDWHGEWGGYNPELQNKARTLPVYEVLKTLLDHGANIDAKDREQRTPLAEIAALGSLKCEKLLIERGAKTTVKDMYGATPLYRAVLYDRLELARALLDRGASVNDIGNHQHFSYLTAAANNGSIPMVRLLLEQGADINAKDNAHRYRNALIAAVQSKSPAPLVRFLLDHGAKVNVPVGDEQRSAMDYALMSGDKATIALLRKAGARTVKYPESWYRR